MLGLLFYIPELVCTCICFLFFSFFFLCWAFWQGKLSGVYEVTKMRIYGWGGGEEREFCDLFFFSSV